MVENRARRAAFYITAAVIFLAAVTAATILLTPRIMPLFKNRNLLRQTLLSSGWKGGILFIGLQALQVFIAFIPGEPFMIAGGYIYGSLIGVFLTAVGILIGEAVAFYATRFLGEPLVKLFLRPERQKRLSSLLNGRKGTIAIVLLFLIPGIPKDSLAYLAGISPIRPVRFLLLSMAGRFPCVLGASYIGADLQHGSHIGALVVTAAAVVLLAAGMLFKNRLLRMIENHHEERKRNP